MYNRKKDIQATTYLPWPIWTNVNNLHITHQPQLVHIIMEWPPVQICQYISLVRCTVFVTSPHNLCTSHMLIWHVIKHTYVCCLWFFSMCCFFNWISSRRRGGGGRAPHVAGTIRVIIGRIKRRHAGTHAHLPHTALAEVKSQPPTTSPPWCHAHRYALTAQPRSCVFLCLAVHYIHTVHISVVRDCFLFKPTALLASFANC